MSLKDGGHSEHSIHPVSESLWIHPASLDKETNKDRLETKIVSVIFPRAAESVKDQRFCDSGGSGSGRGTDGSGRSILIM